MRILTEQQVARMPLPCFILRVNGHIRKGYGSVGYERLYTLYHYIGRKVRKCGWKVNMTLSKNGKVILTGRF